MTDWSEVVDNIGWAAVILVIVIACFLLPAACSSQNHIRCANGTEVTAQEGDTPSAKEVREVCKAGRQDG